MSDSKEIAPIDQFKNILLSERGTAALQSQLPDDVDIKRFTAVAVRAVQENPELLQADKKSLFLSCQRAAQDGLIPDNRQGALVVYNQKVNDQWVKKVQWQPMIGGLRKMLANHGYDLRSELIYENDTFHYELGDSPSLTHSPAPLGTPRGAIIGAYAIATAADGRKYREVMDIDQLNEVKNLSKAPGGPWSKFPGEMHRKTPAKRLFKYLPLPDDDERLWGAIDRDNEQFQDTVGETTAAAKDVQAEVRKPSGKPSKALPEVKKAPPASADPKEEESESPPAEEAKPAKKKKATKKKAAKKEDTPPPKEPLEGELVDDDDDEETLF